MKKEKKFMELVVDSGEPFILWEDKQKDQYRQGMIIDTAICDNSECQCRDVTVYATRIDERMKKLKYNKGKITASVMTDKTSQVPLPKESFKANINIDTAKITDIETDQPDNKAYYVDFLEKALAEKDLFEIIERRWRMVKKVNFDNWKNKDWSSWEQGELISWNDIFPDDRQIVLNENKNRILIDDQYCITPGCTCKNITVSFISIGSKNKGQNLGAMFIDTEKWQVDYVEPAAGTEDKLIKLWQKIQKKYPSIKKTLLERMDEMKTIGKEITRLSGNMRIAPLKNHLNKKVGRNEPCPCGSGKKYKKCCLVF
jgi:hypothetical protein